MKRLRFIAIKREEQLPIVLEKVNVRVFEAHSAPQNKD